MVKVSSDYFNAHAKCSVILVVGNVHEGALGQVEFATAFVRTAIVDFNNTGFAVGQVGYAQFCPESQRSMGCGILTIGELLAAGRSPSVEFIVVIRRFSAAFVHFAGRAFRGRTGNG